MVKCKNCGKENTDEDTFCSQCGKPLNDGETSNKVGSKLNLKIIIPIVAIVLIAVVGFTMLGGGKTVVLDGVDFNIPNGFEEVSPNELGISGLPNAYLKGYMNEKNDFVAVSVSKDSGYSQQDIANSINSGRFTAKNINGYDGAFQITSGGYGCAFFYIKDGKAAMVYASDESFLSQLVK